MGYDWEKIFENKTDEELYDIVIGKQVLNKEAVSFAKKELESRDFDFQNMEANKAAWEVSSLTEEEDYAQLDNSLRFINSYVSLKILLLIILSIIGIYIVINELTKYSFPLEAALYFSGLSTLMVLLNNFLYKKRKQSHEKRIAKINYLQKKLDEKNLLEKDSPIQKEVERQKIKEKEGINVVLVITGILVILLFIFFLLKVNRFL